MRLLTAVYLQGLNAVNSFNSAVYIIQTFDDIRAAFPDTILVWVDILPRFCWRAPKTEYKAIDRKRRRVNQLGHQAVEFLG